jgi:hypothetical protein
MMSIEFSINGLIVLSINSKHKKSTQMFSGRVGGRNLFEIEIKTLEMFS